MSKAHELQIKLVTTYLNRFNKHEKLDDLEMVQFYLDVLLVNARRKENKMNDKVSKTHPVSNGVYHPNHYQSHNMEVIEIIEAFDLGFSLGNVIKYVLRSGKSVNELKDLEKAKWYLEREIDIHKIMVENLDG